MNSVFSHVLCYYRPAHMTTQPDESSEPSANIMNKIIPPLLTVLLCFVLKGSAFASGVNYPNFNSPEGLIFQADARLTADFVRLTPSHTNMIGRVGGLWLQTKQAVLDGFETTFQFRVTDKVRHGADGFALVLQNNATPSVGSSGYHLGFVRGGSAFAVKFVDYHWRRDAFAKFDEIAVTSCDREQEPQSYLATVSRTELFSDGEIHTARVQYVPGNLSVFLDDLEKPILVAAVKLEDLVSFDNGLAWVGFTASTGADSQNQDLLSWAFNKPGETPVLPQLLASSSAGSQPNKNRVTVVGTEGTVSAARSEPQVIGLPVVDGKGKPGQPQIGLPSSVGLTHHVYASTDLVSWTLVTNLSFYFSDPSAPDYDHRFYTFREK